MMILITMIIVTNTIINIIIVYHGISWPRKVVDLVYNLAWNTWTECDILIAIFFHDKNKDIINWMQFTDWNVILSDDNLLQYTCKHIVMLFRQRLAPDVALWTASFVPGCAVCGGVVDERIITRGKSGASRPEAVNVRQMMNRSCMRILTSSSTMASCK